jgi:hypothetical protein
MVIFTQLELTEFNNEYPVFVAIMIGVTNFLFYFCMNLAHWIYGFKYWIVSREMPN